VRFASTQRVAIEEFCITGSGGTPSRSNSDYYGGDIPWVKSGELRESIIWKTEETITEEALRKSSAKIVPQGAILLAMYGATVGRLAILGVDAATNQAVCNIRPDPSKADAKYLYRALEAIVPELISQATGGAQPNISQEKVRKTRIPLPPLNEQKRIAAILDKADALRVKRRQAIALLDSLTQSIFLEMFGDPVSNPKGWKYQALEDIVEAVIDCPHSTPNWVSFGKIALRTSNLTKGGWNWSDTRYVTDSEFVERSRRRAVKSRDIVLSREGTVGIAAIVAPDMEVCLGQRLVQIAPDEQRAVSEYLLQHLLFNLAPNRISHVMVGATSQHINVKDLRKLKIMIPSLQSQMEFKSRHDLLSGRLEAVLASAAETDSLFSSLQHRAFTGQL